MHFEGRFAAVLCIAIFFLYGLTIQAQVNTEKYRKYGIGEGYKVNFSTFLNFRTGKTQYTSWKGNIRVDYSKNQFGYFLVGNLDKKSTSEKRIQNEGFLHLRGIWRLTDQLNWESFLQRQFDEFIDLRYRNLVGTTLNYRWIDKIGKRDSTARFSSNVSIGIMYEMENYSAEPDNIKKYLFRSTNFFTIDWSIHKKLSLNSVVYYQPAYYDFKDFRMIADLSFDYYIHEYFALVFLFSGRYNSKPVTPVKKYDLSFENGFRVKFP